MKITDFKIIEAGSIETLTELVKAELPAWSVLGSVSSERIALTSPADDGSYSQSVFRICLGTEEAGTLPQSQPLSARSLEGASAEAAEPVAKKKTKIARG